MYADDEYPNNNLDDDLDDDLAYDRDDPKHPDWLDAILRRLDELPE